MSTYTWLSKLIDSYLAYLNHSYYIAPESLYKPVADVVISDNDKMSLASKIASNVLKRAPSGPESTYGELWSEHVSISHPFLGCLPNIIIGWGSRRPYILFCTENRRKRHIFPKVTKITTTMTPLRSENSDFCMK